MYVSALVVTRAAPTWRAGAGATAFVPAASLGLVGSVVAAVLAGPVGVIIVVVFVVTLVERTVEVREVVVVAAAVSLITSSLISFSTISSLEVAAVLLGTFIPAFRHPRRGRRLERGESGRRRKLTVGNTPEPGKLALLWLADGDVRIMWVGGDVGVVVDLPQVHTDAVADAALPACRRSLGDLP
jgi:hypothetical protein